MLSVRREKMLDEETGFRLFLLMLLMLLLVDGDDADAAVSDDLVCMMAMMHVMMR